MTPEHELPAGDALPDFDAARARVEALEALLEAEFAALRTRSFDDLERLQTDKLSLLESLQATAQHVAQMPERPAPWAGILEALQACRAAYRRNELLVVRQLEVVRATLRSMQTSDANSSIDLYDRLGQMARRNGGRGYSEA